MAWTSPMTAVDNQELTAQLYNVHVRDNFMELAPAKATVSGGFFAANGSQRISERYPTVSTVATTESTTSATYVDLATEGPEVTVSTGKEAIIFYSAQTSSATANVAAIYSFEIVGDLNEDGGHRMLQDGRAANETARGYGIYHTTGLEPGTNTFRMKYKSGTGGTSASFTNRELIVFPL
jgi:hypothetical protein